MVSVLVPIYNVEKYLEQCLDSLAAQTFGDFEAICRTVVNTLADVSGVVCDGAKPSCAAKIASSVDAAILAVSMAMKDRYFRPGEGIVKEGVEATVESVGQLAREGMRETDSEILKIMVG